MWRVFAAAAAYAFSSSFTVVFSYYLKVGGRDEIFIGAFSAASLLPFLLISHRLGDFVQQRSRLGLISISGIALFLAAQSLLALDSALDMKLLVIRAVQGIGHLMVIAPLFAYVTRLTSAERRPVMFGRLSIAFQFGAAVGAAFAGSLLSLSARNFLLVGMAGAALAIPFTLSLGAAPPAKPVSGPISAPRSLHRIVPPRLLICFLFAASTFGVLTQFAFPWSSTLATSAQARWANAVLPCCLFGSAAGRLLVGQIRLGPNRVAAILSGAALTIALIAAVRAPLFLICLLPLASLLVGVSYGLLMPKLTSDAVTHATETEHGRAVAGMVSLSEIGYRGAPLVIGGLAALAGYGALFAAPAIILLISVARKPRQTEETEAIETSDARTSNLG